MTLNFVEDPFAGEPVPGGHRLPRRVFGAESLVCGTCRTAKSRSEFFINGNGNPRTDCKSCSPSIWRAYYDSDTSKQWSYALKGRYNITVAQYMAMLKEQDGLCAICKQPERIQKRGDEIARLSVDHDHRCCPQRGKSCGKCVRRLLCSLCNHAIGIIEGVPGLWEPFAEYLSDHGRGPLEGVDVLALLS
jgi:hypothetical protein